VRGALGAGRSSSDGAAEYVRDDLRDGAPLAETVRAFKPTILIGLTGRGGLFDEAVLREVARHCERPILFPLSNPTANAECSAELAFRVTEGRCIFASGSPFADVPLGDGRVGRPSQANNMYSYPGIGLGVIACGAQVITPRMLHAASVALAECVPPEVLQSGRIFPPVKQIRKVSKSVAVALAREAYREGYAAEFWNSADAALEEMIERNMWWPAYGQIVPTNRRLAP
jgi:malic enzyme